MPVVTDVTEQRRRKTRVNVFLDGEFWCGMARLCQLELQLTPGRELSDEDKKAAEKHIAENDAVAYCVDILSQRPRTRHQLAVKLRAREYAEELIEPTLDRCEELLLLDDAWYARSLAESRRNGGQGRRRVSQKLREDGVDADVAELVLDETFLAEDETDQAQTALLSKFTPPLARRERDRATAFLVRRGFSYSAAAEVIARHAADAEQEAARGPGLDEAVVLVSRKYPRMNPRDPADMRKAQGFLARRGCSADITREALRALRD